MTVKMQLKKALALFGPNGEKWVSHTPGFDGTEYCAVSAIVYAVEGDYENRRPLYDLLHDELTKVAGSNSSLPGYNDTHTFADIKALFERAIEAA